MGNFGERVSGEIEFEEGIGYIIYNALTIATCKCSLASKEYMGGAVIVGPVGVFTSVTASSEAQRTGLGSKTGIDRG